jgi:tetratricopeptide (TPR) repeat protein
MVERSSGQIQRALEIYRVARNFAASQSDFLQATYHNGLALALKATGRLDDALIEMSAAGYHFEQAGHQRYLMATQVNLGNLLVAAKNYSEAHRHLERGAELAQQLRDDLHLAQALDSLALAHLAQGNPQAAESVARKSVEILERGEQYALLIDSMVTLGRVLARLRDDGALRVYVRAYELAADKIGGVRAGSIATELISELAGDACLRTGTTLDDAVNAFEASVINAALDATGGKQLEAAMRLGLKHQTLSFILNTRHKNLHPNPDRKQRQRSIIKRK